MQNMTSPVSEQMLAWQKSGGALATFAITGDENRDLQPTAAAGSNGGYIGSCIRLEQEDDRAELSAASHSGPWCVPGVDPDSEELSAAAGTRPNPMGGCFGLVQF